MAYTPENTANNAERRFFGKPDKKPGYPLYDGSEEIEFVDDDYTNPSKPRHHADTGLDPSTGSRLNLEARSITPHKVPLGGDSQTSVVSVNLPKLAQPIRLIGGFNSRSLGFNPNKPLTATQKKGAKAIMSIVVITSALGAGATAWDNHQKAERLCPQVSVVGEGPHTTNLDQAIRGLSVFGTPRVRIVDSARARDGVKTAGDVADTLNTMTGCDSNEQEVAFYVSDVPRGGGFKYRGTAFTNVTSEEAVSIQNNLSAELLAYPDTPVQDIAADGMNAFRAAALSPLPGPGKVEQIITDVAPFGLPAGGLLIGGYASFKRRRKYAGLTRETASHISQVVAEGEAIKSKTRKAIDEQTAVYETFFCGKPVYDEIPGSHTDASPADDRIKRTPAILSTAEQAALETSPVLFELYSVSRFLSTAQTHVDGLSVLPPRHTPDTAPSNQPKVRSLWPDIKTAQKVRYNHRAVGGENSRYRCRRCYNE